MNVSSILLKVGCCGWCVKGGRKAYFQKFNVIELQDTFYNLPRIGLAEKWRREAPEDFEFCVKAWQIITHPYTSPTWRRLREKPEGKLENYGFLRPTEENFRAWEKVREVCKALRAKICVLQTPPSFGYSEENVRSVKEFFSAIASRDIVVAWEPRGTWNRNLEKIKEIVDQYGIVHVVDPFKRWYVSESNIVYFRLHGKNGEINYRYKYTNEDLKWLWEQIRTRCLGKEVYVMFNNVYMAQDAMLFKEIAKTNLL